MLRRGTGVYFQVPNGSGQSPLYPGTVVGLDGAVVAVEVPESDLIPDAGESVLLYFDQRGDFVKQEARVGGVMQSHPRAVMGLEVVGKPQCAENRQSFRVSTAMTELTATIEDTTRCRLLDVSAAGFAVVCAERFEVGRRLSAVLDLEGDRFTGHVDVRSATPFDDGLTRYGLCCVDEGEPGLDLQSGLLRISVYVQREQLKRLTRTA